MTRFLATTIEKGLASSLRAKLGDEVEVQTLVMPVSRNSTSGLRILFEILQGFARRAAHRRGGRLDSERRGVGVILRVFVSVSRDLS